MTHLCSRLRRILEGAIMRQNVWLRVSAICLLGLEVIASAHAEVLITAHEAALPTDDTNSRALYIGPNLLVVAPTRGAVVKSPFDLKIKFERRDGVEVDMNSLSVTYRKMPLVDLTQRIKEFVTPDGIDMPTAEVPTGKHRIHVEVKDVDGRIGGVDILIDATN
jgi:hypothetical protein